MDRNHHVSNYNVGYRLARSNKIVHKISVKKIGALYNLLVQSTLSIKNGSYDLDKYNNIYKYKNRHLIIYYAWYWFSCISVLIVLSISRYTLLVFFIQNGESTQDESPEITHAKTSQYCQCFIQIISSVTGNEAPVGFW